MTDSPSLRVNSKLLTPVAAELLLDNSTVSVSGPGVDRRVVLLGVDRQRTRQQRRQRARERDEATARRAAGQCRFQS